MEDNNSDALNFSSYQGDNSLPLVQIDRLLSNWANHVTDSTKQIINSALGKYPESLNSNGSQAIITDISERQSRVITTIQEAHARQLEILKTAISDERREFSRAQLVFEQSLRTKYDHSIEALRETIQSELDARMLRTLKSLEQQAKLEGDRARQVHDFEYEVEHRLSLRLKEIIGDLRKSWEEEEVIRMKQIEEKISNNYNIVLEHMEAQLKMALQLQDDADQKWLEDLDIRNKKQLENIRLFENKCRQLYETRLIEYAEKTSAQISSYEDKLLEVGSVLAAEKNQFESRLRRVKLACSRWKVAYQAEVHGRYRDMTSTLDERYSAEVIKLLNEIQELKGSIAELQKTIELKEKEVQKAQSMSSVGAAPPVPTKTIRQELLTKCEELKLSSVERVDLLVSLLDSATGTPQLYALYETIASKLSARVPIVQLMNRRQFLEYKLKLATKPGVAADNANSAEKADMISELTDIKANIDRLTRQYEKTFKEPYLSSAVSATLDGGGSSSLASPGAAAMRRTSNSTSALSASATTS